jgi:Mn-dependent DtxR family transcriptional regulator
MADETRDEDLMAFNFPVTSRRWGDYRLECIRLYMASHLGARAKDVAKALNLSPRTVGPYIKKLRDEWNE